MGGREVVAQHLRGVDVDSSTAQNLEGHLDEQLRKSEIGFAVLLTEVGYTNDFDLRTPEFLSDTLASLYNQTLGKTQLISQPIR
jgi:hypothetical protein